MVKHLNIRIFGRVQGVLFRASTQREAQKFGINGFIRNETDGSVYVEAQGEDADLEKFVKWCQHGPVMAKVVRIETEETPLKQFSEFKVL